MFCDHCGQPVAPTATTCPHCGGSLDPATPPPDPVPRRRGRAMLVVAVVWRRPRATLAGIVGAWFNVPFILLMTALGGIVGGLAGVVSGTIAGHGVLARINTALEWVFPLPVSAEDLLPTAAAQIGGIVGGLLGAMHGSLLLGWMAAAWPWEQLYAGDPVWPAAVALGQVLTALFCGALYVTWAITSERWRLHIAGARPLSRREAAWLLPLFGEAAARLGISHPPTLLIDDRREPNAAAACRHLVVNAGLLEQVGYDRGRVAAVLAHELAHWQAGDPIAMAWSRGVALPLYLLYELADRLLRVVHARPLQVVIRILFWAIVATVRYLVIPLQASTWRRAEHRADAAAAAAGYGPQMREVLELLRGSFEGGRSGWDRTLLATHPVTEQRLENLETPGRTYPLREDHPLQALPGGLDRHRSSVDKGWRP